MLKRLSWKGVLCNFALDSVNTSGLILIVSEWSGGQSSFLKNISLLCSIFTCVSKSSSRALLQPTEVMIITTAPDSQMSKTGEWKLSPEQRQSKDDNACIFGADEGEIFWGKCLIISALVFSFALRN